MSKQYNNLQPSGPLPKDWIVGFTDAEGCFSITISVEKGRAPKVGHIFEINLNAADADILYKIRDFFGVGNVTAHSDGAIHYMVQGKADLIDVIIPFFTENPLITDKWADFQLWSTAIKNLSQSRPPQSELNEMLTYYAAINRGMSKKMLSVFLEFNLK